MTKTIHQNRFYLRRSVLSVPAINQRAIAKIATLDCDAVIFDLEDSVAPEARAEARQNLLRFFAATRPADKEYIIRINALSSADGLLDLALVLNCEPNAVLLPKVQSASEIQDLADFLYDEDAPDDLGIWAMIETARGVVNVASIAETAIGDCQRFSTLVLGLNDLRKDARIPFEEGRANISHAMQQVLMAARAYGLDVIDSVFNDFQNAEAFADECKFARSLGYDGKMLIHPSQIKISNEEFAPSVSEVAAAEIIFNAFAKSDAKGKNVLNIEGKMVERLHAEQAQRLIYFAEQVAKRKV